LPHTGDLLGGCLVVVGVGFAGELSFSLALVADFFQAFGFALFVALGFFFGGLFGGFGFGGFFALYVGVFGGLPGVENLLGDVLGGAFAGDGRYVIGRTSSSSSSSPNLLLRTIGAGLSSSLPDSSSMERVVRPLLSVLIGNAHPSPSP